MTPTTAVNKRKAYVIDTNVIISNPKFMNELEDCDVVIPIITLEELDKLKSKEGNTGFRCRQFFRLMKEFTDLGQLNRGMEYINGITLSTTLAYDLDRIPKNLDPNYGDNKILALEYFDKNPDAILVTADISMAVKAGAMDINVEVYNKSSQGKLKDMETGYGVLFVPDFVIDEAYESKDGISKHKISSFIAKQSIELFPNKFFIMKSESNEKKSFLCRYSGKEAKFKKLEYDKECHYGVLPKDAQQKFAWEALLNDEVKFVTMTAEPGTGKTFLSVAVALSMTEDHDKYEKVLIAKNTAPIDKWSYQGFTTGSTEEKLLSHFANYATTLENLDKERKQYPKGERVDGMSSMMSRMGETKSLEILDVSSILGASFADKFIIIDEAQSFDVHAVRSIITRIGEGCKLVMIGDLNQQTIAHLDPDKSGLYCAVDWLKELDQTAHVTLKNIHRSSFVKDVSEIFDKKMFG